MKKLTVIIALIIFTLSLLSLVSAEHTFVQLPSNTDEGFYLSSANSHLSMCACSTGTDIIEVVNSGGVPVKISLSSNLDYVSFSSDELNLIPGQMEMVYLYVHAPCKQSTDNLEIIAESIYGETQVLERTLSFKSCDNLVVVPKDDQNVSVCTPFKDTFKIFNTGSFLEQYEVVINSFEEYSSVPKKTVSIPAYTVHNYTVDYNIPCDISGNQELSYTVYAIKNNRELSFSKELFISPDYKFGISGPSEMNVCDSESKNFTLTLENQNHFEDEFYIELDAPSFVDLVLPKTFLGVESNTLVLNASTINELPLVISPNGKKHDGEYNVSITVASVTGEVGEELILPLNINHCYDFTNLLSIPFDEVNFCSDDTEYVDIILEHKGVSPVDVALVLTGPDFVTFAEDIVSFNGKEAKKATLIFDNVPNLNEKYPITVDAYSKGELVDSDSFMLNIQDKTSCFAAVIKESNVDVRFDAHSFDVEIQNKGDYYGEYDIIALNKPTYLSLEPTSFALGSSEQATLNFIVDRTSLEDHASIYNNGSIVGINGSLDLVIQRSTGQEFLSILNFKFVDKPWYEWAAINAYAWWSDKPVCTQIFLVLSFLATITLIVLLVKVFSRRIFRSANILGLILLLLVIIVILSVLIWKGIPTKGMFYTTYDLDTNSTIYLNLAEDTSKSYNLDEFFFDPDENIVTYNITLENASLIDVTVRNNNLIIDPARDWNGLTSIQITAIDEAGAHASSGDIYVEVMPVEDYSLLEFFSMACHYFNALMFTIFALLIYLASSFKKGFKEVKEGKQLTLLDAVIIKKKTDKKNSNVSSSKKASKPISKPNKAKKKSTTRKRTTKKQSKKTAKKAPTKKTKGKNMSSSKK